MNNKVKLVKFAPLTLKHFYEDEQGNYATMAWSIRAGYPRLTVYTDNLKRAPGTPLDWGKIITGAMDYSNVFIFLDNLKTILDGDNDKSLAIKLYNTKFENNVKTDKVYLQATVKVGKDKDGVVYIETTEDKKRHVRFNMMPNSKWYKYETNSGDLVSDISELSVKYARSYHTMLTTLIKAEVRKDFTSETSFDKPATVGGAGSGYTKPQVPHKADITAPIDELEGIY